MKLLLVAIVLCCLAGCASGERPVILVGSGELSYPPSAKVAQVEGYVTVRYDVSVEGAIQNIEIVDSAPPEVFDEAVLAYVSTWRFIPATKGGKPVAEKGLESTIELTIKEHVPF